MLDLLGDAAERAPVVVVAEDAHWLDAATAEVLAFVARRIEADAIAMLITSREEIPRSLRGAGLPARQLAPLDAERPRRSCTPATRVRAATRIGSWPRPRAIRSGWWSCSPARRRRPSCRPGCR